MGFYIEPVYLNEKMVLNCAAYVFKGVSLETEVSHEKSVKGKGTVSLGLKFLQDLISPLSFSAEGERGVSISEKTARRYTLGGLHMTLVDALNEAGHIGRETDIAVAPNRDQFIELDAVLRPIDFFSIIEAAKVSSPLIAQLLQTFGTKFNAQIFNNKVMQEIPKYEKLVSNVLSELEGDYLRSGQLEMVMIDPDTARQIGVVDVDLSDLDALSVKAKLTDGRFRVIGRVYRHVGTGDRISIVQRTIISSILNIIEKLVGDGEDGVNYRAQMRTAKSAVEKVCQFYIDGPAIRVMAMSICI
ncbi:DUF6414 family protein [Shumkonia mesophila]|uniref:DUF6414 family protein n=1 Tax=Shumkonia mesophila TaxID=2838854 RepID=UPI0029343B64|nr:hypothetical protein [Shumkonia mesophila]